ncbi:MAG: methyltransferase type 11 [Anaerolineaceae bacterium]|nr:methyltransferase type 11 [Anaerolineaceae bacterium]
MKPVSSFTDSEFLKSKQYKDSSNLSARIALHRDYGTCTVGVWQWFFDMLLATLGSKARILEVGAGRADLWRENADRIPEGWEITLTDLSDGMLEDGRKQLGDLADRFEMHPANVQELADADNTYDAVIANFMLYHLPDRPKGIAQIRRVLKPDGVLFACTLGHNHMRQYWELVRSVVDDPNMALQGQNPFTLNDGAEQLGGSFDDIVMVRYHCDIKLTDVEPMVAYFHSNGDEAILSGQYDDAVRQRVQKEIDEKGHFFIQKDTGVFVARGGA